MIKAKLSAIWLMSVLILSVLSLGALAVEEYPSATGGTLPILVSDVKVNGDSINAEDEVRTQFTRDNKIDVEVKLFAQADVEDVEIEAVIYGDEYETISDTTDSFDVENGTIYEKDLELELPSYMEQDDYKLRIIVSDRNGREKIYRFNLKIDTEKHSLVIDDVTFNPGREVIAGRALLSVVRVENLGEQDEESVKVTLSIPDFGVSASDFIDEIEQEDTESSEELYLRIPACAEAGEYDAKVVVEYDRKRRETSKTYQISVVAGDSCGAVPSTSPTTSGGETVVTASTPSQELKAGEGGVIYPVTISNQQPVSKTYTISVQGIEGWSTVKVSPGTLMTLNAGQTETAYIYVSANEGTTGSRAFTVEVKSGSEVIKQIQLTANIAGAESTGWSSVKKGLEIGLVVLIVLLVILGLVIAFNKYKGSEEETGEEDITGQTYY